jgi:predicted nucleotidyltransferase
VALYYKVPLWSDRHFELMGKSLKAFQEVGNKLCIVNLTVDSRSLGNTESMVRWVKKPDGTFDHDFTIAEKYLDLVAKGFYREER